MMLRKCLSSRTNGYRAITFTKSLMFVSLLGNLFSIPEKSNSFLRWVQSIAACLCK